MTNQSKTGGVAAFIMAAAYIIGIGLAFTLLDSSGLKDPVAVAAFHVELYPVFYLWITFIYIVAGAGLVPLSLALYDRVAAASKEAAPLARTATVFAVIWAALIMGSGLLHNVGLIETVDMFAENPEQAAFFWTVMETVHVGIGASIEIPGGLWTLLISVAALQAGAFPKGLNIFAIIIGAAGLLSIIPPLTEAAVGVYALGQIVWWIALGFLLMKNTDRS